MINWLFNMDTYYGWFTSSGLLVDYIILYCILSLHKQKLHKLTMCVKAAIKLVFYKAIQNLLKMLCDIYSIAVIDCIVTMSDHSVTPCSNVTLTYSALTVNWIPFIAHHVAVSGVTLLIIYILRRKNWIFPLYFQPKLCNVDHREWGIP